MTEFVKIIAVKSIGPVVKERRDWWWMRVMYETEIGFIYSTTSGRSEGDCHLNVNKSNQMATFGQLWIETPALLSSNEAKELEDRVWKLKESIPVTPL